MKTYTATRERLSRHDAANRNCQPMHTAEPNPRPHFPSWWRLGAIAYTAMGVVCVASSAAFPESEAAMLAAIAGALPWSLALLTLDLTPGVAQTALILLAGGWAFNAALLWWRARRRSAPPSELRGD
ncbi:hypothetical protein J2X90_002542 [Variovorax paradoxus]|uniref:hypothetical protein n=1 Tax=Variovorax paradoxus TaxID=34073 RepID=UPI00278478F6|nr:hypothetical protein [Variovorax paradoxus]MDQ0024740.1 hypothetical protein [Variovorax paradoxus]